MFVVTKKDDMIFLISIFDKYTLNTTKYLDYLDFKKAFNLYIFILTFSLKVNVSYNNIIIIKAVS